MLKTLLNGFWQSTLMNKTLEQIMELPNLKQSEKGLVDTVKRFVKDQTDDRTIDYDIESLITGLESDAITGAYTKGFNDAMQLLKDLYNPEPNWWVNTLKGMNTHAWNVHKGMEVSNDVKDRI